MIGITCPETAVFTVASFCHSHETNARAPTVPRRWPPIQLLAVVDNDVDAPARSRTARGDRPLVVRAKDIDGTDAVRRSRRGDPLPRGRSAQLEDLPGDGETRQARARSDSTDEAQNVRGP